MGMQSSDFSRAGFACIAPSIYIQDPQMSPYDDFASPQRPHTLSLSSFYLPSGPAAKLSARSRDTAPPDLIILTTWTGAAAKHITKYTAAYNTLYPNTPILVITTALPDLLLRSTTSKLTALAPAVSYLLSHQPAYYHPGTHPDPQSLPPTTPRFPSLLLHAFSEGGAHKAVLLAQAYQQHATGTGGASRLPVAAFIFDSTPGSAPTYRRATTAFARSLPGGGEKRNSVLMHKGRKAVAAGVVGCLWLAQKGGELTGTGAGAGDFIEETRRALNDERLWEVKGVPRTYLFGEGDEVVWWGDVHRHGVESAGLGGDPDGGGDGGTGGPGVGSLMVRFKRTEHCAHVKGEVNGKVYWAAVRQTWEARVDGGMGLALGLGRRLSLDSLCLEEGS